MPLEARSAEKPGKEEGKQPGSSPETTREDLPVTAIADDLSLAQLLDACSRFLDRRIEFQPKELSARFHPLPGASYTAASLLAAANRDLASQGEITIQPPGSSVLRVVKLSDAKSLAGLLTTDGSLPNPKRGLPGFVRVLIPLQHVEPRDLVPSIQKLLSKHGEVTTVGNTSALLVADLTPRISSIMYVLRGLDVAAADPAIETYKPVHVSSKSLAIRLEQLVAKRNSASDKPLSGSTMALDDTGDLLFIAPTDEIHWWLTQAKALDRAEPARTVNYTPRRFGLGETRELIEAELAMNPFGSTPPYIVTDALTGTLVITTTPRYHESINAILTRLELTESSPEPKLRAFKIGNRPASEVQALLSELLSEGALSSELESTASGAAFADGQSFSPNRSFSEDGVGGPLLGTVAKNSIRAFRTSQGDQGEASITVDTTTNQILAFGPPKLLDRIEQLIETLDLRQAQILVEATVVSLSDAEAKSLGVELAARGSNDGDLYQLASLFGVGGPSPGDLALPALAGIGAAGTILRPGSFSAAIHALETATHGRTLTRPKLLVNAGRTADLGSVLQTPFLSTNAGSTVSTTSLGGTLDAGTQILVTPQVGEAGRISLKYTISLSSFVGAAADPNLPPPRQENHIQSEVTIPDGYTVVVGGLEVANEGDDQRAVPLLGRIPFLGALFRDESSSSSTSRFYVFLRCTVMTGDQFEGLRHMSDDARDEVGLPSDVPAIEPMIMR